MDGTKRLQSKVIPAGDGAGNQSPEMSRRKDKWVTERQEVLAEEDVASEGKNRRRLQDPVALEDNLEEAGNLRKPFKRGRFEHTSRASVVSDRALNPEYVPRSGPFFEHDDRGLPARQRGISRRRPFVEGGDRGAVRKADDRWDGGFHDSSDRWHHDRFNESERAGSRRGGRGRRFENGGRFRDSERWTGRRAGMNGRSNSVQADRGRWGEDEQKAGRTSSFRTDRYRGPAGEIREPKDEWKHDLFDQRHYSPAAKREEASVARVEALLAA